MQIRVALCVLFYLSIPFLMYGSVAKCVTQNEPKDLH